MGLIKFLMSGESRRNLKNLNKMADEVEKLEPKDFLQFFKDFRKAYDEFCPLFYMFTVSAKAWYDGFAIEGADC